jgi:hypothetical protein
MVEPPSGRDRRGKNRSRTTLGTPSDSSLGLLGRTRDELDLGAAAPPAAHLLDALGHDLGVLDRGLAGQVDVDELDGAPRDGPVEPGEVPAQRAPPPRRRTGRRRNRHPPRLAIPVLARLVDSVGAPTYRP